MIDLARSLFLPSSLLVGLRLNVGEQLRDFF